MYPYIVIPEYRATWKRFSYDTFIITRDSYIKVPSASSHHVLFKTHFQSALGQGGNDSKDERKNIWNELS